MSGRWTRQTYNVTGPRPLERHRCAAATDNALTPGRICLGQRGVARIPSRDNPGFRRPSQMPLCGQLSRGGTLRDSTFGPLRLAGKLRCLLPKVAAPCGLGLSHFRRLTPTTADRDIRPLFRTG